ncbi:MAG TPA: YlxR family protein [Polyangiaceae bacterium]|nr:YlxR family protein [Polyangiaceae bacterium]
MTIAMSEEREKPRAPKPDRSQRTCVGCGHADGSDALVRLVVSPEGEVAVDLAGGKFGRGAHVHASPRCLASAQKGLSKSFRRAISITAMELAQAIAAAADRRITGLLSSAARQDVLEVGAEKAGFAYESGKAVLLVVARDAAAAASVGKIMHAVAEGGAVAWGTKAELGSLVGKMDVAVLGIASRPLAASVRSAAMVVSAVGRIDE